MQEELINDYAESVFVGRYIDQVWPPVVNFKELRCVKDLTSVYSYVELFTDRRFNWVFHVRVKNCYMPWAVPHSIKGFQDFYTTVWKVFEVSCPICHSQIFRINRKKDKAQCKKGHLINFLDLLIHRINRRSSKPSVFTR